MALGPLLGLLSPTSAWAFCRTRTVDTPADYNPAYSGCWMPGLPLFWSNACVGYDIQENASEQISYDDAAGDIALAFTRWTSTTCSGSHGTGRVSIDVRDLGPVACDLVQYNENGPNQHVIIFRDHDWPYDDTSNALALTTVTFDIDTGEIYDADMEINTYQYMMSVAPQVPMGGYDFLAIVTHETGHFLGMAHSTDMSATMYARYAAGSEAMRLLQEDDIDGICTIYPPDGSRTVATAASPSGSLPETACDPTPRHGFTSQCIPAGGCSVGFNPGGPDAWAGVLGIAAVLSVRKRREPG
jgi:MYXO-CTERM domain-containing protein